MAEFAKIDALVEPMAALIAHGQVNAQKMFGDPPYFLGKTFHAGPLEL